MKILGIFAIFAIFGLARAAVGALWALVISAHRQAVGFQNGWSWILKRLRALSVAKVRL
jgi:hypothetical protein